MANAFVSLEDSFMYRFQCALSYPLVQRCQELIKLIEQCSFRDAHALFPLLVESVFGFGSSPGWGLNFLCRHLDPREFDAVRYLLSPSGPLVSLAYQLMNDVYLKYEFPLACLPSPVVRSMEEGVIPLFYAGKLQSNCSGRFPDQLSLNPYEFVIFHLSYFLIRLQNQKSTVDCSNAGDYLYVYIIEDYLNFFLPCDGTFPSPPPYSLPLPVKTNSPNQFKRSDCTGPSVQSIFRDPEGQRGKLKNLFKQSTVTRQLSVGLQQHESTLVDLWRSEVLIQALVEFWLNHYTVEKGTSGYSVDKFHDSVLQRSYLSDTSLSSETSPHRSSRIFFAEPFFPSTDHIRLVRMLIKHLHYFVNSAQTGPTTIFDDFKKAVISQVVRKKLYSFIRYMFNHWPLDASFRLVLEMWLSYIQPWRYTNCRALRSAMQEKLEERDRVVSLKWQSFIEENLLFYSLFFQKMIPRLLRVDLYSPKNAGMLHRLTKVFSQANLKKMIQDAESFAYDPSDKAGSLLGVSALSSAVGRSILSRSAVDSGHAGSVKHHVAELEGPSYVFVPMFGNDVMIQVKQLQQCIQQGRAATSSQMLPSQGIRRGNVFRRVLHSALSALRLNGDDCFDENNFANAHKLQQYLDVASLHLANLFPMQAFANDPVVRSHFGLMKPSSETDRTLTDDGMLTPVGRYQVLNRMMKTTITHQGDPDLQPIRHNEIAFLVRILYRLSSAINEKYATEIRSLNERSDFVGRLFQQFIQPSIVCYDFEHHSTPSPRNRKFLPPRVSLRRLAKKENLGYIAAFYLLLYVFNYDLFVSSFILLALVALFVFCTALVRTHFQPGTSRDRSPAPATSDCGRREDQMADHELSD